MPVMEQQRNKQDIRQAILETVERVVKKEHDIEKQVRAVKKAIPTDPDEFDLIKDWLVDKACRRLVYDSRHAQYGEAVSDFRRTPYVGSVAPAPDLKAEQAANEAAFKHILDLPIGSLNKRLRDCTGKELAGEIEACRRRAAGFHARASLLEAFANIAGEKRVGDVCDDNRAAAIASKYEGAQLFAA